MAKEIDSVSRDWLFKRESKGGTQHFFSSFLGRLLAACRRRATIT